MKPVAVAKRYARALADYAEEIPGEPGRRGRKDPARLEPVASELARVATAFEADARFGRFFADPSVPLKEKRAAIEALAAKGKLSTGVRNFLGLLVTHRRMGALGAIRQAFAEIKDDRLGVVAAETTTAVPLSAAELKRLREALEKLTGRTVNITQRVDPALLGGARTRVGSRVYDGTLRHQLDTLRERLIGTH